MKSTVLGIFIAAAMLCSVCQGQRQQINLPTEKEIRDILNNPDTVKEVVDCVIQYNERCDPRLYEAYVLAPDYLNSQGDCRGDDLCIRAKPTIEQFLKILSRKYRSEYKRLLTAFSQF